MERVGEQTCCFLHLCCELLQHGTGTIKEGIISIVASSAGGVVFLHTSGMVSGHQNRYRYDVHSCSEVLLNVAGLSYRGRQSTSPNVVV